MPQLQPPPTLMPPQHNDNCSIQSPSILSHYPTSHQHLHPSGQLPHWSSRNTPFLSVHTLVLQTLLTPFLPLFPFKDITAPSHVNAFFKETTALMPLYHLNIPISCISSHFPPCCRGSCPPSHQCPSPPHPDLWVTGHQTRSLYIFTPNYHLSQQIYQPECPHQHHCTMSHIAPQTMWFHQSTSQHLQCRVDFGSPNSGPGLSSLSGPHTHHSECTHWDSCKSK
jgi:hypothetical protein